MAMPLAFLLAPLLLAAEGAPAEDPSGPPQGVVRVEFGPAEMVTTSPRAILQMWNEATYRKIAAQLKSEFKDRFGVLGKPPREATEAMRFGVNLQIDGTTRPWALLNDGKDPAKLWIDFDADGDLDDETPLVFAPKNGEPVASFSRSLEGKVGAETVPFDCAMEFTLGEIEIPGGTTHEKVIFLREKMLRRGTARIGDRKLNVAIVADGGIFDDSYQFAFFDLDGSGDFELENRQSLERFRVDEGTVRLFDHAYEFKIDRYGRFLDLIPTTEFVPERANIAVGEAAPALEGTDLDGKSVKLSDYAGKYVLLDFWSVGCAPCVAELPKLIEAYARYHEKGFEILGISGDESRLELLKKLIVEKGMKWPQIAQRETKGPLMRQFRIQAFPTCYLLDQDGTFLLLDARADKLLPYLEHLFDD